MVVLTAGVQSVAPQNDTDLFIYSLDPAFSTDMINTDFEQPLLDSEGNFVKDADGNNVIVFSFWHVLKFLKRDLRLGNLNPKMVDIAWMVDRLHLAETLLHLREGAFKCLAPSAIMPVLAELELSQSQGGFLRKNFRTFSFKNESEDKSRVGSGFFNRRKN